MHVAGKFSGNNAWKKWINENFDKKSLANEQIGHKVINCNY